MRNRQMSTHWESMPSSCRTTDAHSPLAFEAEFDGIRRQQPLADAEPSDPDRYWDIFSGTD
jgi:hypothetical protein